MSVHETIEKYLVTFHSDQLAKPTHCKVCRKTCPLRWHGHYKRSVITHAKTFLIPIKRVLCSICRHTFALLPSFLVKFHRYAKETILKAIKRLKSHTFDAVSNWFMEKSGRCVATLTLYLWRRKFV